MFRGPPVRSSPLHQRSPPNHPSTLVSSSVDNNEPCVSVAAQQVGKSSPNIPPVTATTTGNAFGNLDPAEDLRKDSLSEPYYGNLHDFYGLPSCPVCVYRTGDEWPDSWDMRREARPVYNHPLKDVWHTLHIQIYQYLDSIGVDWSTIDPVYFADTRKNETGPVHLWIGVVPGTLSFKDAKAAAVGCKQILANANLLDIEIAFRKSIYVRSSGPRLLEHKRYGDLFSDIQSPFTPSLGIQIAPKDTLCCEGTGGVYLRESNQSKRVFLLTARHIALPQPTHSNELYSCEDPSQHRVDIVVLGKKTYIDALASIVNKMQAVCSFINRYQRELYEMGEAVEGDPNRGTGAREDVEVEFAKAKRTFLDMNDLHDNITTHWSTPSQRVLGYILHAPPISPATGPKWFTDDWALIDLDLDKIDWDTFKGNAVYIGTELGISEFINKIHPHPEGRSDIEFDPSSRLLQINGVVEEAELHNPKQLDANGEQCLIVLKNGKTSGLTIGRASSIESVIREHGEDGVKNTFLEVGVYPYGRKDREFSAPGDSGSIVVDGKGRVVGMLTGGSGTEGTFDVGYVTPYFWIEERIKEVFPDCLLYPSVDL